MSKYNDFYDLSEIFNHSGNNDFYDIGHVGPFNGQITGKVIAEIIASP